MKKVLILANHDVWVYKLRKEVILELIEQGYEVYISTPKGEFVPLMVEWGCKFIETKVEGRSKNPFNDLNLLFKYIRILKKVKPNAVLAYTIKPNIYGGLASRFTRTPYINNITGLGSGFIGNPFLKKILSLLYKVSLKKSNIVFFQNKTDMKILLESKIVHGPSELIPGSGVNLTDFGYKEFPEHNIITFNYIGRIMRDKGIDQFLEAAKIIKGKYPNTQFNIIGYVEKTQNFYNEVIQDYHENGFVNYLGFQADIKPFIEKGHCLIQPSHGGEGISNVLLESAAAGRALIASNIPGCKETIEEGINGYIFEKKNTHSLVEKIENFILLSSKEKLDMGKKSREKVEKEFDRQIVVNAYIKGIESI